MDTKLIIDNNQKTRNIELLILILVCGNWLR